MAMLGAETHETDGSGIEAREYLRIIVRRRWTVIITVLVCAALAAAYAMLAPKSYPASATVLVKPVVTDWTQSSSPTDKTVDTATEQQIAVSDAVVGQVRSQLHLTDLTVADIQGNLVVTPGTGNATTLTVTYTDPSAQTAHNVALAVAQDYLARRTAAAQASLKQAQQTVQAQVSSLEKQLSELEAKQTNPTAPQTPSESIAANQISSLRGTLNRLSLATVDAGSLIGEPLPADELTASPKRSTVLGAGILLGLLLGLILAFVRDRMSNRVVLSPTSSSVLRPAVLETVPLKRRALKGLARSGGLAPENSAAAAAFARASEHVRSQFTSGNALVVVTSPSEEAATSVVATNLAAALAATDMSVTLITRQNPGTVAAVHGGAPAKTFADVLNGRASLGEAGTVSSRVPALRVVPLGDIAPGRLRTNSALDVVRMLQQGRNVLVVDAPALLAGGDGLALAAAADVAIVTVVDGVTRRDELAGAADHVSGVGPALVQSIVVAGGRAGRAGRSGSRVSIPAARSKPREAVAGGHVRTEALAEIRAEARPEAPHPSDVS